MTEDWAKPSAKEVELALASIADLSLRAIFFGELENPEWLGPLRALRVFDNPPQVTFGADGVAGALPWPEGDYLVKVAAARPAEVGVILRAVKDSGNPWVQRAIVSAASNMPPEDAKQLVQPIAVIVRASTGWLDAQRIMETVEKFYAAGDLKSVRTLLEALFRPKPGPEEEMAFGNRVRIVASIDDYFYTLLLPRAIPMLAAFPDLAGLRIVMGWLTRAQKIQYGGRGERSGYNANSLWRPSIAQHPQNSGLDRLSDSLIDAVRDTALALGKSGQQVAVIAMLSESSSFLVRRIAAEVAGELAADVNATTRSTVDAAYALMVDSNLMTIDARPEYVRLARAVLPMVTGEQRDAWVTLVRSGAWEGTDDDMRRRISGWDDKKPEQVSEGEIKETRAHIMHRFLQPLADVLPEPLDAELASLVAQRGTIDHAEFGSWIESFTGPNSPKRSDELADMTSDELYAYLKSWQPAVDHHFGPSIEGLARELEAATETKPDIVMRFADKLMWLRRSYVRAILSGWAKAVPSGFAPSENVWAAVRILVLEPDDGTDDDLTQRNFDSDDPVWRFAQRSAIDLISARIKAFPMPAPPEEVAMLWELLKPLTQHPDPTPAHEDRFGGSNMDPLTLSLNTTRPAALRAAISLVAASHAEREPGEPSNTEAAILEALGEHVPQRSDPSLAVAAVLGEGLGRLWGVDPSWLSEHEAELFALLDNDPAKRTRSDVLVSVALRVYQTGTAFLSLIRPAMAQMFSPPYAEVEHVDGWREHRSAVEAAALHVLHAYLRRIIERDDDRLIQLFSGTVVLDVVSDALGHIGWEIMRWSTETGAQPISHQYLERAKELVEWRVDEIRSGGASARELGDFYWWAQSEAFPASWWLPILLLAADRVDVDSNGMLGKPLADAAEVEPGLAIEAFERIYGGPDSDWRGYDLLQHAPRLLSTVLRSSDQIAIERANKVRDLLGRQGHFDALRELEQLLS